MQSRRDRSVDLARKVMAKETTVSRRLFMIVFCLVLLGLLATCAPIAENAGDPDQRIAALELNWPPLGEVVDASPVLQWYGFSGASRYHVVVAEHY
jgi:hypothetical protein